MTTKKQTVVHGIAARDITYNNPGNNLPRWVRETAETRGYGDATQPLSLYIQEGDIAEAFTCAAQGNGSACVMAQAGRRIGAKSVYFYRTTVWVDFGDGPIVRYKTSRQIYKNVVDPFDRGARQEVVPGIYHLTPPKGSGTLNAGRAAYAKARGNGYKKLPKKLRKSDGSHSAIAHAHTERVVMASRASS